MVTQGGCAVKRKNRPRLCFIGDCGSVHLQRWRDSFSEEFEVVTISSRPCDKERCFYYYDLLPQVLRRVFPVPKMAFVASLPVLKRVIVGFEPDILHIHQLSNFGIGFALSGFCPTIISVWGNDIIFDRPLDRVRSLFITKMLKEADLVTATSNFLGDRVRELGRQEVSVVPFGVDLAFFDPTQFGDSTRDSSFRIGFFKHLEKKYGPEYLVRAFSGVVKKHPEAELFMAGEGSLRGRLERLVCELEIQSKVRFLGFVKKDQVPEIMAKMDITIMPSIFDSESFGVAALESEALGVPVVASRVGGVSEVVKDGKTGILIPPKDSEALSKAICRLVEDKALRLRMGMEGRKLVELKYDWGGNVKQMMELYGEILGSIGVGSLR